MKNKCAAFNHGVYKNSYSPYGGWYNASTDALVALVTQFLTLFVWGNNGPNNGFLLAYVHFYLVLAHTR